jgi:hypothetical protein
MTAMIKGKLLYKVFFTDLYGEKIIVSRTVTHSSSSYKLKDQHGRVVVEKNAKEELDRLLARFNIQALNIVIVS